MPNIASVTCREDLREDAAFGAAARALHSDWRMRKRELLVAGLIACGTTALIVDFTLRPGHERARFHYAVTEVRAIESAAMLYIEAHPGECPTLRDLKDAKIVDETRPTTDPWNTELRVVCDGGRAKATSAGPDKQFDTEDDIGVPGATKSR